jgi:hypothetical protein
MHELREQTAQGMQGLHLEILRQFEIQQAQLGLVLEEHAARFSAVMTENEQLRNENELLKNVY